MSVETLNAEKLVADHLRHITSARLVAENPGDGTGGNTTSWVRVTLLDGSNVDGSGSDYFVRYYLQFDCYAGKDGGQPEATALGRSIRKALREMRDLDYVLDREGDSTGVVCSDVDVRSHARVPDVLFKPSRERIIITAFVYLHP